MHAHLIAFFSPGLVRICRTVRLFGVLLPALAAGVAASTFTTELSATKRILTPDSQGRVVESWIAFAKLLPGEEVAYAIVCTNQGAEPAAEIVVSLPIPAAMVAIPREMAPGVEVTYSIDGGKTFDRLDRLAMVAPDGATRPARAEDIGCVRWKLTTALGPGGTTTVGCHAILK